MVLMCFKKTGKRRKDRLKKRVKNNETTTL